MPRRRGDPAGRIESETGKKGPNKYISVLPTLWGLLRTNTRPPSIASAATTPSQRSELRAPVSHHRHTPVNGCAHAARAPSHDRQHAHNLDTSVAPVVAPAHIYAADKKEISVRGDTTQTDTSCKKMRSADDMDCSTRVNARHAHGVHKHGGIHGGRGVHQASTTPTGHRLSDL